MGLVFLKVSFDVLSNRPSANRAVIVSFLERGLAVLAYAQVPAGQDHDTLFFVLAHHTEFVLSFPLHLLKKEFFDVFVGVIRVAANGGGLSFVAFLLLCPPLEQQVIIAPFVHHALVFVLVRRVYNDSGADCTGFIFSV